MNIFMHILDYHGTHARDHTTNQWAHGLYLGNAQKLVSLHGVCCIKPTTYTQIRKQVQSLYLSMALWTYWLFAPHFIAIALYFAVPVLLPIKK
jgi:hypothetical protein